MNVAQIESLDRERKRFRDEAFRTAMLAVQHRNGPRFERLCRSAEGLWRESYDRLRKMDRISRQLFKNTPWMFVPKEAREARRQLEEARQKRRTKTL